MTSQNKKKKSFILVRGEERYFNCFTSHCECKNPNSYTFHFITERKQLGNRVEKQSGIGGADKRGKRHHADQKYQQA